MKKSLLICSRPVGTGRGVMAMLFLATLLLVVLLASCNFDFDNLFSRKETGNRGYTVDELEMFYEFAKLATIKYVNLNQTHLQELGTKITYGVKTHTIDYASEYNTERIRGSAALVYPNAVVPSGGWPLLISIHHTMLRDVEAPSVVVGKNSNFSFDAIADFDPSLHPLLLASSMKMAVYAPDLLGFGASRDKGHPFMNKDMLLKDILLGLDAAVETFESMGISINKETLLITGYSHGAWLATQLYRELDTNENYAKHYTVLAGISSGGVYNVTKMGIDMLSSTKSGLPLFFPYMIYGYEVSNTLDIDYKKYYKEPYDSLDFEGDLFNGSNDNKYVDNKLNSNIQELYTDAFIADAKNLANALPTNNDYSAFWTRLTVDSIEAWKLSGKYLIIHHKDDKVLDIAQVYKFENEMKTVENQNPIFVEHFYGNDEDQLVWGDPDSSAHEATAIITYISGLHWLASQL